MPWGGVELVLLVVEAGSGEEVDLERDLGRPEVLRGTVRPRRRWVPSCSDSSPYSSSSSSVVMVHGGLLRWGRGCDQAGERLDRGVLEESSMEIKKNTNINKQSALIAQSHV